MVGLNSSHTDEISALLAIAVAGSFSGAGNLLGRHPTIISKRIASFEARLGVRLVERTTRQIQLTDTGQRLAQQLRQATDLISEAQQEAAETATELRGTLRLTLPATMGRLWLAPYIPHFMAANPDLTLEAEYSDNFVDVVEGGFDAAVRIGHLPDSRLVARRLVEHRRILAASPLYLERCGLPTCPADLEGHNCMGNPALKSFPFWRLTGKACVETVRTNGTLRTNDSCAMLEAALAGTGILGAGEWLLAKDLAAGRLIRVLPEWTFDGDGGIYLVRASRPYASAKVQVFTEWLTTLFSPPPWTRLP
ncbi:LysR family transcriptional regulator [Ewingella sp. S1.OA.A_B6]